MADNQLEIDDNDDSQDIEGADLLDPEGDDIEDSTETTASEDETSWITWFVSIRGNDFFCEVEEAFAQDDFNLTGLSSQVPYYDYALDMILDIDIPLDVLSEEQHEIVETAAEVLYGLIHARYILTTAGMNKMLEKYGNVDFGRCPRSLCQGQPVLPVGLSDVTREFSVEVFCPRCHETYHPRSSKHANLDGAYFGTTFCHLFLLTHPQHIVPQPTEKYVPRIFGFRINENSQYYKLRKTSGNTISNGTSSSTSAGGANSNSVKASSSNTSAVRNNNNGAAAGALLVSSTGATPLAGAHSNSNNAVAMPSKQGSGGGNTAKTTLVSPSKGIA